MTSETYTSSDRELTEQVWEPIRIVPDYSEPEQIAERDPSRKQDLEDLKNVFDKTVKVLSSLLKVKRLSEPLKVDKMRCGKFDLPLKAQATGEGYSDADLLILVKFDSTGLFEKQGIEAAATDCIQDAQLKRPIVGYIQFKPNLELKNQKDIDYFVWLSLHEMTHVLGFNDRLYSSFIDSETLQTIPISQTVALTNLHGEDVFLIKSPNVLEKARKHFNCNRIQGVPAEYNGGQGTAGAHWSKHYLNTEYMIGDSYGENIISEITLALLEDSGWYKVDYTQANLYVWGRDAGCSFFSLPCYDKQLDKTNFPNDFCEEINQEVCSNQNIFRAICKTMQYEKPLPIEKQFFPDPRKGGIDELVDYCPIAIEDSADDEYYGGSCRFGHKGKRNIEKVCPHCACFENTLKPITNLKIKTEKFASCFEFTCNESIITVLVDGNKAVCDQGRATIEGYSGSIKCPDSKVLCHKTYFYKFGSVEKY